MNRLRRRGVDTGRGAGKRHSPEATTDNLPDVRRERASAESDAMSKRCDPPAILERLRATGLEPATHGLNVNIP